MTNVQCTGNYMKGSGRGLIQVTIPTFACRNRGNTRKTYHDILPTARDLNPRPGEPEPEVETTEVRLSVFGLRELIVLLN
jgi:hypothetical protein